MRARLLGAVPARLAEERHFRRTGRDSARPLRALPPGKMRKERACIGKALERGENLWYDKIENAFRKAYHGPPLRRAAEAGASGDDRKDRRPFRAKRGEPFMAEEMTNPVEAVPAAAEPAQAAPASAPEAVLTAALTAAPAAPDTKKKGSPLLVFLTVLLILVGIIDVMLWGVAGYYLLQKNVQIGTGGAAAQSTSIGGAPVQGGSGSDASSDDEAKREALEAYIQELVKITDL